MLVQPTFAVSVIGQICMGTMFVLNKQAVQECYVGLSHGSLRLFRQLQFLGSCTFNLLMASSSMISVVIYEQIGQTAPFLLVAGLCAAWSLCVTAYFLVRYRSHL